jgi:hypothetical protein
MTCLILTVAIIGLASPADDDKAAMEIGRTIQAVDRLLEYRLPAAPTEADHVKAAELRTAAVSAGQKTRIYPWVTGRLKLEVDLMKSFIRDTLPKPAKENESRERIAYLYKLMYEIDAPR